MCGIAGIYGNNNCEMLKTQISDMISYINHRGPDGSGIWIDNSIPIALGHCRLSIHDLTSAGNQPMISHNGRFIIIFNGEIYNYKDIKTELETKEIINWQGHSDTEILIEAISRWGVNDTLNYCVGMFAFGLWDRHENTLYLARDRIGEKPLYYSQFYNKLIFASELSAFKAIKDFEFEINKDAVSLLVRHNYIPAPYTIYKKINKLMPGCFIKYEVNKPNITVTRYWDIKDKLLNSSVDLATLSEDEYVDNLEYLISRSVKQQLLADVPVGAFLSGGIDSSTIVAMMQKNSTDKVKTFTIGFNNKDYNESDYARNIANHLGTDHTEAYVDDKQLLDTVPQITNVYSEPFSDSSQIPTILVSKLAKSNVKVSLSGDGGDELFGGYTRYKTTVDLLDSFSGIPQSFRNLMSSILLSLSENHYDNFSNIIDQIFARKVMPKRFGNKIIRGAHAFQKNNISDIYLDICSHSREPSKLVRNSADRQYLIQAINESVIINNRLKRLMCVDLVTYLPEDILVKVDRAAMSVGLETRVPFLDHRLVEYCMATPENLLNVKRKPKWPLRRILGRYVPESLFNRPKMGFGVPIDVWLRGPLREWAEDLIDHRKIYEQGIFNAAEVSEAWESHQSGDFNNQYLLWDVLMFQSWMQNFHMRNI